MGINLVIVSYIINRFVMLDLGINNEEPHNMFVAMGEQAGIPYGCASLFSCVTFQEDPTAENVYLVHSTASGMWSDADVEDDVARAEINGSFRKNADGEVLFSGVFECVYLNEDSLPVHNIVHVDDMVVVKLDNNHVSGHDVKNDCYIEIA